MSGLILLTLIGVGFIVVGFVLICTPESTPPPAPPPLEKPQALAITAKLQRGEIITRVSYRGDGERFQMDAERIIRQWAAGVEIPKVLPEHYEFLDSLLGEALAGYSPRVISIDVPGSPLTQTEAQKIDAELVSQIDCVDAVKKRVAQMKATQPEVADTRLNNGFTVAEQIEDVLKDSVDKVEDYAKRRLVGIFHDPQRQR